MNKNIFVKLVCAALLLCSVLNSCATKKKNDTPVLSVLDTIEADCNTPSVSDNNEESSVIPSDTEVETNDNFVFQRPSLNIPGAPSETVYETTVPETTEPEITVSETTVPETTESVNATVPESDNNTVFVPYDVPLTIEQQKAVEKIAARFNVDEELAFAVMYTESRFNPLAVNKKGTCFGIMQIAKSNLKMLTSKLGITDLLDFEQNVTAGCYFLGYYGDRYDKDPSIILLNYHGGPGYAQKMLAAGKTGDAYTAKVIKEMNRIIEARKQTAAEMGIELKG